MHARKNVNMKHSNKQNFIQPDLIDDEVEKEGVLYKGKRKQVETPGPPTKKAMVEKNFQKHVNKKTNNNHNQMKSKEPEMTPKDFQNTVLRLRETAEKMIEKGKSIGDVKKFYKKEIDKQASENNKMVLRKEMDEAVKYDFAVALARAEECEKNGDFGYEYFFVKAERLNVGCYATSRKVESLLKEVNTINEKKLDVLTEKKKQYMLCKDSEISKKVENSRWYKIIQNTVSIEGNTFKLEEVKQHLDQGLNIEGRSEMEHKEVSDAAAAIKFANENLIVNSKKLELLDIKKLHKMFVKNSQPDTAGMWRQTNVTVGRHLAPNFTDLHGHLDKFMKDLNQDLLKLHPVLAAARAHHTFESIYPFKDGNGRVGRCIMNIILQKQGYPAISIPEEDMNRYFKCLNMCEDDYFEAFLAFIADCTEAALDEYIDSNK